MLSAATRWLNNQQIGEKMKSFNYRKVLSFVVAILTAMSLATPASAAEPATTCYGETDCLAQIENLASQIKEVTAEETSIVVDAAKNAIQESSVELHQLGESLDYTKSSVYRFNFDQQSTIITIPSNNTFGLPSNVTIVFNDNDEVTQYNETAVTKNADGTANVTTYIDGEFYVHKNTDTPFLTRDGIPSTYLNSVDVCATAVLGVSAGLGALIASVCAGACVGAATGVTLPACLACVGMFAALGSGSLSQFIACIQG